MVSTNQYFINYLIFKVKYKYTFFIFEKINFNIFD